MVCINYLISLSNQRMLLDKVKNISVFFLVVTIPIARLFNINSYAIVLFSLVFLFTPKKKYFIRPNVYSFFFYSYFALLCLNLLIVDQPDASKTIVKYLPLLLIPFVLLFVKFKKVVLEFFVYSIVLSCIICIIHAFVQSKGYIFYYHNPSEILDIQLNYLAIFVCFALAIIYHEIIQTNVIKLKHYLFVPILFFSLAVFYNRAGLITCFLITLLFIILYFKKFKNFKLAGILAILFIVSTGWILSRPIVQSKFQEIISIDLSTIDNYDNGINSRILSWECSIENIKKGGLLGYGPNNSEEVLTSCYQEKAGEDSIPFQEGFNAHNQFLQTTLDLGLIGLALLLMIYGSVLYLGIKKKDPLLIFYFIILVMFGMTESFLIRQWGFVFFAFFTPYLLSRWAANMERQQE